ncbi:MAG: LysR family transcriptional regulator [Pseudolysinimonas sp.]
MHDLDIRLVRYFVTVAHTLHFSRAAEQLYISQPALSQAIAKLEKTLGAQLLTRDNRSVELTDVGTQFLPKAEELLSCADNALSVVQRARRDMRSLLRVGFIPGPGRNMTRILEDAERIAPSLTVRMRRLDWINQEAAVVAGDVDVSFARAPLVSPELDHMTVDREGRVLAVSERHPLAGRGSVSIRDIAEELIITSATCPSEEWAAFWAVSPRPDDAEVLWGPAVDTIEEMLEEASRGHGVCITAESIARGYQHASVSFVPIADISDTTVEMCWRRDNSAPMLQILREAAQHVVEADPSIGAAYGAASDPNRHPVAVT